MDTDDFILRRIPAAKRPLVVLLASVSIHFTLGLVYTFGNMLPYLISYLRWKIDPTETAGSMIWLQSMMAGFPCAMLAGGYLERHTNARSAAFLGCVLYTGGFAFSYYAIQNSFYALLLSLGVVSSFGNGITYNAVLIQCQRWFPEKIGLASGLITAGFGSGAFLIAPLQTELINPSNEKVNAEGYFDDEELLKRIPRMFLILGCFFGTIQLIALLFIAEPKSAHRNSRGSTVNSVEPLLDSSPESSEVAITDLGGGEPCAPSSGGVSRRQQRRQNNLLRSSTFICLFITLVLNGIWIQTMSGLYKAFGQLFIQDDFFLATINSLAAVSNCVSRVVWGVVGDRISYKKAMAIACSVGASLMWTLIFVKESGSRQLYLFWICAMFSCVGATFSLLPYATHKSFGSSNFGVMYGYVQMALTISGLVTALLSQFLLHIIGFEMLFSIVGFTMFASFLITLLIDKTQQGSTLAQPGSSSSLVRNRS